MVIRRVRVLCGGTLVSARYVSITVADLRRRLEGAMPPLREEKAINKVYKLLLEGAKIIDFVLI